MMITWKLSSYNLKISKQKSGMENMVKQQNFGWVIWTMFGLFWTWLNLWKQTDMVTTWEHWIKWSTFFIWYAKLCEVFDLLHIFSRKHWSHSPWSNWRTPKWLNQCLKKFCSVKPLSIGQNYRRDYHEACKVSEPSIRWQRGWPFWSGEFLNILLDYFITKLGV